MNINSLNPFALKSSTPVPQGGKKVHVSKGGNYPPVEIVRNTLCIPEKILLLNSNMNSGNVSTETLQKVVNYLEENQLYNVHVSVNEYNPKALLELTLSNENISLPLRYTVGLVAVATLTLNIPKLFGVPGDHYNPWANMVYLVSEDPSIALHECGHAKDFNTRQNPGFYSLCSALVPPVAPFVALYKEFKANQNVYFYLREKKSEEGIKTALTTLSPAYATYVAGARAFFGKRWGISHWMGVKPFIKTVIAGHIAGQITARAINWKFDR